MTDTSQFSIDDARSTKLKHLPTSSGVYLMKDVKGAILYVGKAKCLRSRVKSYFTVNRYSQPKTTALMNRIMDVDFIATDSEVEALILEDNLVKKHKPRYNILLRDDKSFPFIKVTNEPFPKLTITRNRENDGARYFGPYTNVRAMRRTLDTVRKVFPTRTCDSPRTWSSMDRPCLEFDIKRCTGPCKGHISEADYGDTINQVCEFLSGKKNSVMRSLTLKMKEASDGMEYEVAASIRDQINTISRDAVKQRVHGKGSAEQDVFGVVDEGETACISVLTIREGKMVDKNHFFVSSPKENSRTELLEAFLSRYYLAFSDQQSMPEEIVIPMYSEEMEPLNVWLSESKGKRVVFTTPQRGHKVSLLGLAERNAKLQLDTRILRNTEMRDRRSIPPSVEALQECLRLQNPPRRIETFDVSNIQGALPVASMVCFVSGKPKKKDYRRYDIKGVVGPNDFAMMREVVGRRYRRIIDENGPLPDLVVIDGGKGQLSSAKRVLDELGLVDVPVVGLAKRLEEVFYPERPAPVMIPKTSPALKLLMQARDEAHRFAVTFHRNKRSRSMVRSVLDNIPGIGAKRRQNLLRTMGSVEKIRLSSVDELAQVEGIGKSAAQKIYNYLHPDGEE